MPGENRIEQFVNIIEGIEQTKAFKGRLVNLMSDFHHCEALSELNRHKRMTGGHTLRYQLLLEQGENAMWIDPTDEDTAVDVDGTEHITMHLALIRNAVIWNMLEAEVWKNSTEDEIFNGMMVKIAQADQNFKEKMEHSIWSLPTAIEPKAMWSIPFWIVHPGSGDGSDPDTGGQYVGANPVGFSTIGGIDTSLEKYRRVRNYAADVGDADSMGETFVSQLEDAIELTRFKSPISMADIKTDNLKQRAFYTTRQRRKAAVRLLRNRNDYMNDFDLTKYGLDTPVVNGIPLIWVQKLDDDPAQPFYGINWKTFDWVVQKGFFNRRETVRHTPNALSVTRFEYLMTNLGCFNRRENFCLADGSEEPTA